MRTKANFNTALTSCDYKWQGMWYELDLYIIIIFITNPGNFYR